MTPSDRCMQLHRLIRIHWNDVKGNAKYDALRFLLDKIAWPLLGALFGALIAYFRSASWIERVLVGAGVFVVAVIFIYGIAYFLFSGRANPSPFPDEEILDSVAESLRSPKDVFLCQFKKAWCRLDLKDINYQSAQEAKLVTTQTLAEFVERYYPPISDSSLGVYSVSIDGQIVKSTVYVKYSDIQLARSIDTLDFQSSEHDVPWTLDSTQALGGHAAQALAQLCVRNIKLWNSPTYRLLEERIVQGEARFSIIDFFAYRFSFGLLEDELIGAIIACGGDVNVFAERKTELKLRGQLLPDLGSLTNLKSRICAGGIGVVFAIKDTDSYRIPIQIRSGKVSDGRNRKAVFPKAFHQPLVDAKAEANIRWTVFRELYEEAFGGKEVKRPGKHLKPDWYFEKCQPVAWFQSNTEWRGELVSYGLNAVSGNFDFGILILVEDPQYWQKFGKEMLRNWESKGITYVRGDNPSEIAELIKSGSLVSESLVHFVEALRRLKQLHPDKMRLPDIDRLIGGRSVGHLK